MMKWQTIIGARTFRARLAFFFLLLGNLGWMYWNHFGQLRPGGVLNRYKLEAMQTNGVSGVGLFEVRTGQPLWVQFYENGQTTETHYSAGKKVFNILLKDDHPPVYSVFFRGSGGGVTSWVNRGGAGTFTERAFYDTNGELFRDEAWYNEAWHTVDRRNGRNGIIVGGKWYQLAFDTNGMWTIGAGTEGSAD
jgi:hypothetical protein